MDIILLGAPGAGKGTQAKVLEEHSGFVHVASGDLFRAALRQGTELGMLAKAYMDRGELVPDEVVIRMIIERISQKDCADGVIFDGFPRTREQARALEQELVDHSRRIDYALFLAVPEVVLLRRIAGRQTCKTCGSIYNIYYFPSKRRLDGDGTAPPGCLLRPDDAADRILSRAGQLDRDRWEVRDQRGH